MGDRVFYQIPTKTIRSMVSCANDSFEQLSIVTQQIQWNNSFWTNDKLMLHYKFNSAFHVCCGSYNRVDCSIEFCGRSGDTSSVSCEGVDPLDEGLAPSEMMFLNQAPWKVGLPLFWLLLPWESGAASFFGARPATWICMLLYWHWQFLF
jgi:hypothetical protein